MSTITKNVLIVVDLQNCFIHGGSLGEQDLDQLKKYYQLVKNIEEEINEEKYDLVVFSKDKHPINHSSLADHISAEHGVYLHHCRNIDCNCNESGSTYFSKKAKEKVKEILLNRFNGQLDLESTETQLKLLTGLKLTDTEIEDIKKLAEDETYIKKGDNMTIEDLILSNAANADRHGSENFLQMLSKPHPDGGFKNKRKYVRGYDLNYLFNATTLSDVIDILNTGHKDIGIKKGKCINSDISDIEDVPIFNLDTIPLENKYVTIPKGERCNYESYSAFNYHIKINKDEKSMTKKLFQKYDSSMNKTEKLPAKDMYSTGLFEYIIKFLDLSTTGDETTRVTLNINVCGLVTNICVINTLQQGIALWNSVYSKRCRNVTCNFKLLDYISVPLSFDIHGVDYLNYPYSDSISSNKEDKETQIENLKKLFNAKFKYDILEAKGNDRGTILNSSTNSYEVSISKEQEDNITFELDIKSGGKKSIRNKARTKTAEKKPATKKAAEKKPATKKAAEKKPATKKAAEKKPATKKAAEKKPATKKA